MYAGIAHANNQTAAERVSKMAEPLYEVSEIVVYKTKNLGIFKIDLRNRPVNEKRAAAIATQILNGNNLLSKYPISVNERLEIIDGQHRDRAAEIAQLENPDIELYFTIDADMTIDKAVSALHHTKNWNNADEINRWARIGNEDYIALQKFWKEHDWMTITHVIRLCSSRNYKPETFKNGLYKADRMLFAQIVAQMAQDFQPYLEAWKSITFIGALMQLASDPNYSHRRMMDKMQYQSGKLRPQTTVDFYLENFTEIYNYRTSTDHRVHFRATTRVGLPTPKA